MRQVPDCLKRRYKAVDELVKDLSSTISDPASPECGSTNTVCDDAGIKLMCKFWNILKEDPGCNLQDAVKQRMTMNVQGSGIMGPHDICCYQMSQEPSRTNRTSGPASCCRDKRRAESSLSGSPRPFSESLTPSEPLSLALGNVKEAASVEQKCYEKTAELMTAQERLKAQIAKLEQRAGDEVKLLKEADAIWTRMETDYRDKLEESKARQEELLKQQKEVEASTNKWRKHKQDLEEQMNHVDKCLKEIRAKFNQKTNDLKCIDAETKDLEKKIENKTKEIANGSKTICTKKEAAAKKMQRIAEETKKLQEVKAKEEQLKQEKIAEGNECAKEAREELAKLCRVLLKKKLENEDLRAESNALMDELQLLNATCDQCGERCKNKEQSLVSEIEKCKIEIEKFQLRCTKCHVSVDTMNLRRYCTDCLRCQEKPDPCIYGGDTCTELASNECVCISTKKKFMNNVFDNMYTVLERQISTQQGKAVADQVLSCLHNSTNGKLNTQTRQILQNFILAAVKQNLNLTIIGGAVKTRCEMEPVIYKELMLCLAKVIEKPPKIDKGTDSRKEPCQRWGGPYECNCPKGPKDCICSKKAPPRRSDPQPCGQLDEDKEDIGKLSICPHKENTPCGPMCGNIPEPEVTTKQARKWKPDPCVQKTCRFQTNMRAAQCSLGTNLLKKSIGTLGTKTKRTNIPVLEIPSEYESTTGTIFSCSSGPGHCGCYGKLKNEKKCGTKCLKQQIVIPNEKEFKKMYDENDTELLVTVLGQNGIKADLKAELRKTHSGHMTLNVKRLPYIGEIADELKEYPVSFFKTNSSYKLFISRDNKNPNAVLRRHSSGEIDVVLKQFPTSKNNMTPTLHSQQRIFFVRVNNAEVTNPETTLIRLTPSGNYEFVFEKEFEKRYKETVNNYVGDNTECFVNMFKSKSGTYIIDFEEDCDNSKNNKALLSKSNSGSIKLIVRGADSNVIEKSRSLNRRYSKEFEILYKRYSSSDRCQINPLTEQGYLHRQPEQGYSQDYIRIKIRDQEHLVAEFLVNLEQVSSKQYSVIFISEPEALFTANLLKSWQGQLPIEKIAKCELNVYLNRGRELKNRYGYLKLTSNGKVIVVVENKPSKSVETDAYSVRYALKEKGVATNCHGQIDCDCDKSKCICDEVLAEWNDWNYGLTDKRPRDVNWSQTSSVNYPEECP